MGAILVIFHCATTPYIRVVVIARIL